MSVGPAPEYTETARLHAGCRIDVRCGQTEPEELANRCRSRRHPVLEPEIIDSCQFFRREHDLKALGAKVVHYRSRELSRLSKFLNKQRWRKFHESWKNRQFSNNVT